MSDNVHVRSQKYYDPNTMSWVAAQQPALEAGTVNLSSTGLAKEAGGNLATLTAKDFATSAKQDTLHTDLQTLDTDLKTNIVLKAGTNVIGHVIVDTAPTTAVTGTFWQVTQPVSGTVTANAGTNLNTSALALEAGHLATIDTSTAKIPSQGQALAANSLPVVLPATQITTLTPPAAIAGFALEAGHLAAIDTATAKIPALGQALAASSVPIVLTAAQLTTLTPLAAVQANAGTNLNTSLLALDSTVAKDASLTTLNAKDFATAANQATGNTSLASLVTDLAPLVASAAGGYVRQDATGTIALESGGNLATLQTSARVRNVVLLQQLLQAPPANGFVPIEVPAFLIG